MKPFGQRDFTESGDMVEAVKQLLSRRLILIGGKGGVGKSTIAASLALVAARWGRRVLVVEWAPVEQMSRLFGAPEVGYAGGILSSGIYGINLDPPLAFREFMLSQVRLESLYRRLFENPIMQGFIHFMPGLNDLMCMGKVYELNREKEATSHLLKYDVIIFDGPPSAQAICLLQTPSRVARIARVGPIEKHSRAIADLLEDQSQTVLCVVTQPDELAIAETEELIRAARDKLHISLGPIIANAVPAPIFTRKESRALNGIGPVGDGTDGHTTLGAWIRYARLMHRQAETAQRAVALLRRKTSARLVTVPLVLDGAREIERVRFIAAYLGGHA